MFFISKNDLFPFSVKKWFCLFFTTKNQLTFEHIWQ
jgi:hypothetical protein